MIDIFSTIDKLKKQIKFLNYKTNTIDLYYEVSNPSISYIAVIINCGQGQVAYSYTNAQSDSMESLVTILNSNPEYNQYGKYSIVMESFIKLTMPIAKMETLCVQNIAFQVVAD